MTNGKRTAGKVISVPCPQCSTHTKTPRARVTEKGLQYDCPKCKIKIRIAKTDKGIAVRRVTAAEIAALQPEEVKKSPDKVHIIKGAPTWIVTFADLATLLLTFFVLMLSFANMDIVKFQDMMGSVQERYGITMLERGDFQTVSVGRLAEVDSNIKEAAKAVARERLVNVVADAVIRSGLKKSSSITSTDEGVRVRIKSRALFDPGRAALRKESEAFLTELVNMIKTTRGLLVVVEGHTDNRPVHTKKFPSNWELSTLRSSAVLEAMVRLGAPPERLSAAGYADTRPLFSNEREETRPLNRRVEFLFKRG